MHQARICESNKDQSHRAWPTAARAVIPFAPYDNRSPELVVHFLDYAIFTVLQITNIAKEPLILTDLVVNGEFRPAFVIGGLSDRLSPLRLPARMSHGTSFGAVLQAPSATNIPPSSCYPKAPVSLLIATDRGNFIFNAGEIILPNDSSRPS